MYSDDLDAVTNNLRDSAKGSLVTYDDTFPLTGCVLQSGNAQRARPGRSSAGTRAEDASSKGT